MLSSDGIKVIANWSYLKAEEAKYLGVILCLWFHLEKCQRRGSQTAGPAQEDAHGWKTSGTQLSWLSSPPSILFLFWAIPGGGGGAFGDEEASWKEFPMFCLTWRAQLTDGPTRNTFPWLWLPDGNSLLEPLIETSPRRLLFESRQWFVLHAICGYWQSVWPHISIRLSSLSTYEHLLREG